MNQLTLNKFTRRRFLSSATTLGAVSILGLPEKSYAESPPETTTIRVVDFQAICVAPEFLAEELLYAEGFKKVEYVKHVANVVADPQAVDFHVVTAAPLVARLDTDSRLVAIAGIHVGCQELIASHRVQAIRELKGKSIAISAIGSGEHISTSSVVAYVGINPKTEINWVVAGSSKAAMQLFIDGKVDAYWAFEPQPRALKSMNIGHVLLKTVEDRPWSQYFCCLLAARKDFLQQYPVAAKRAARAFLKATDICANDRMNSARSRRT